MMRYMLFVSMLLIATMSFLLPDLSGDFVASIYLVMINFLISFVIVNMNRLNANLINMQSIFLLGFLVFFLGRLVGFILNSSLYDGLFCMGFIFSYCSSSADITYLIFLLHLILISFSMAFLTGVNTSNKLHEINNQNFIVSSLKIKLIYLLFFLSLGVSFYQRIESILLAISGGYMALYASQAEAYETPFVMLFGVLSSCCLAILYSIRDVLSRKVFRLVIVSYVLSLFSGIMTGSRASFIGGLIVLGWLIFRNVRIKKIFYPVGLGFCLAILGVIDQLASLSGARPFGEKSSFLNGISETLYSQGVTLMVFNSSVHTEGYPVLGALKSLIPGIQAIFPLFGVTHRYDFDWSSYMAFNENKIAYQDGFGLGWSIYSDFYILGLGFLPLFVLFIFLFGRLILSLSKRSGYYNEGLILIFVSSLFAINRGQISPLIFSVVVYTLMCLFVGTLKVKKI